MKGAGPMEDQPGSARIGGTRWRIAIVLAVAWAAPSAHAQAPEATESIEPTPPDQDTEQADAIEAGVEPAPLAEPAPSASLAEPDVVIAATVTTASAAPEPTASAAPMERGRGWRLPRETVRRPLTLPQGVMRFDSTVALSVVPSATFSGSNTFMTGSMGLAAGLHDDFEIGATPFGITFIPLGLAFSDPSLYVRARALSGDAQIAFRGGITIPVAGQLDVAQLELAAELAFVVLPWLRIDTGVDYALLFSTPLHQRIGVPVVLTAQASIHAIGLASGVFVFNDFDDVDVPLLLRYTVSFRGFQGPGGEWTFEGGFTDLERAEDAWIMLSRFTFFAYL